jgi:23S rRNA pseudouridine2605 synthase
MLGKKSSAHFTVSSDPLPTSESAEPLTADELQAARAAHWRQNQNPLLTLEEARSWLEQHPLCLYLPRRAQLPAPAPSFVEACLGRAEATPGPEAIAQAHALLTRLTAEGSAVALNLLGGVSEQADFLVSRRALPYVLCLRAHSDWKHAPEKSAGHKASPLVIELWKTLESSSGLTAVEARDILGRELTEMAILRALCELWQELRISPVYADAGQPARWQMLQLQHRDALTAAFATGQVTALSVLVSMYLQSVYAATSEEIEVFLSPVASRSRTREAVRGLSATRQVHSLSMDAQTYYFLEGGLPEFAQPAALPATPAERPAAASVSALRDVNPKPGPRKDWAPRFASGPAPQRISSPRPAKTRPEPGPTRQWKQANGKPGRAARPWQKPGTAPAEGASWPKQGRGMRPAGAGRGSAASPPDTRQAGRPGAPPGKRPGPWTGAGKRERPAAWARRDQGSASGTPRPQGRGESPYRAGRKPRFQDSAAGSARTAAGPPLGHPANRPPSRPPGRSWTPDRRSRRDAVEHSGPPRKDPSSLGSGSERDRRRPGGSNRSDKARPPFASRSGKPWPRTGATAGKPNRKPGKPPAGFRDRKPSRKKPGA